MSRYRLSDGPRPWHLLWAPAVPLVALLNSSTGNAAPGVILWPLVIAVILTLLTWLLAVAIARDPRKAALMITVNVLAGLSYMSIARLPIWAAIPGVFPVLYIGGMCLVVLWLHSSRRVKEQTLFANRILATTLVFLTIPIVAKETLRTSVAVPPLQMHVSRAGAELPNVYVLVFDGYGRRDVLRDVYGFDNYLVTDLRSLGFFVADRAAANYAQTASSLASSLNLDYIPALMKIEESTTSRRTLGDLIERSRFVDAFAGAGYEIRSYASEYTMVRLRQASERSIPFGHIGEFGYAAYESTAVPAVLQAFGLPRGWLPLELHRRHVLWTLDRLAQDEVNEESRPALVFAHLLAPHPPFAFNADGSDRQTRVPALFVDGGDAWRAVAQGSGESYQSGYVDSVRFLNPRIVSIVREVLGRSRRPTIFLIHGDHGPGTRLRWDDPAVSDMRERMGILLAMRFPDGELPAIGALTTPINVYRAIMNRALGTSLPTLEDKSYFATWRRPFAFIDVTDRLQQPVP